MDTSATEPVVEPVEPGYVSSFNALNKWANEYVGFPGGFFRQWVKDFYQQNKLTRASSCWRAARGAAKSGSLCFAVGPRRTTSPAGVREAAEDVGSDARQGYVELPGGHISLIAGRGASVHCWPKVAGWLAARS